MEITPTNCRIPVNKIHEIDFSGLGKASVVNHTGIVLDFVIHRSGIIEITKEGQTNDR